MAKQKSTAESKDWYLSSFAGWEQHLNGETSGPVHQLRRRAIARFNELGLPSGRDEEWRYTNLAPLWRHQFDVAAAIAADSEQMARAKEVVADCQFGDLETCRLVFVNGFWAPQLSHLTQLPQGVVVESLAAAFERDANSLSAQLGGIGQEPFAALNTAFVRDGARIYLPDNTVLATPIHLVFVTQLDAPAAVYPRVHIVAAAGAEADVIETYVGPQGLPYLSAGVVEIDAGPQSRLRHTRVQREGAEAFHINYLYVRQQQDCTFVDHNVSLGGRLVRNELYSLVDGEGIESTLNGLYLVDGQRHVDNHTQVEHARPNSTSHEFYKGILAGAATGAFRGRILVQQAAQKTDAYQANRNLLLSEDAYINSKPQLEIYADDVKCSHGSTVGKLDEDALFYLRTRGVGLARASQLLTRAFAGEVLGRIELEQVRQDLEKRAGEQIVGGLERER